MTAERAHKPLARGAGIGSRTGWLAFVTARPVAVTMFMLAIAVFGGVSFSKLPVDLLPEISYPTLTVRTGYKGAAPEDIENRVSERVQEALSTLPHIVRTSAISRAEVSDVVLDFEWGTPMAFAVQDVRDKLDGVFLPIGADRPLILRYDPNLDPILRIGLTLPVGRTVEGGAERELVQLRWVAQKRIKRELERIPGIAAVQVRGGLEEEIRVRVDPFKMAAQGLDPAQLAQRLAQENLNASGGLVREGSSEYLVRALNEFRNVEEIADLAIVRRGDAVIRVRDVATVTRTHAQRDVVTRLDGKEAVEIAVFREAGANIAALAAQVRERVFGTKEQQAWASEQSAKPGSSGNATFADRDKADFLVWQLRDQSHFEVLSDQSIFIRDSIQDVQNSAWVGGILTMIVIWLALRSLFPTLIISISIPISVIVTFAPMYLCGVSLNVMSLGGLALGIGMLVDASIVVLESISRCREEGDGLVDGAVRGTREVVGAITGSTLTSVAVFAPIIFVHGVAGRIFGDQALTVVASHIGSLLVAAVLIPVLASRNWFGVDSPENATRASTTRAPVAWPVTLGRWILTGLGWIVRGIGFVLRGLWKVIELALRPLLIVHDWGWGHVERAYPRLLGGALKHAWLVVLVSLALFGLTLTRVSHLGLALLPEVHQGEFTAHITLPVDSPLERTDEVLREIEATVRATEGVGLTALVVGIEKDALTRDIEGKHTARLTVHLKPAMANPRDEERILQLVRSQIARHPAVSSVEVTRPTLFAIEAPVQIEILGRDLEKLKAVGSEVATRLGQVEGLSDVRSTVRAGHPEAHVVFDRDKTLEYGLDLNQISQLVRDQVLGNVSTRFTDGDDRIDVRVLADEKLLGSLERVLALQVNPTAAKPVPLSAIAKVEVIEGPAEIRRIGNTRAVIVSAAANGLDLGGLTRRVEAALADLRTQDDVVVQVGGQKREMEDAQRSMQFALLLAVFLVYAVMASQFESLLQPLIILVTVPLAIIGVVFALELLSIPLSVVVFIGMIILAGIVVANAIVLIDRINKMRERGLGVREAILEAGAARLRPIYMTANTTVMGLLPMTGWLVFVPYVGALGSGAGAELRSPLAVTVIAGLTTSTVLTLVVIPSVYYLIYRERGSREVAT